MKRDEPWEKIIHYGKRMREIWKGLAKDNNIELEISGLSSLSGFSFKSDDHLKYKTFITQEMLKKGYLASNLFYSSLAHSDEILELYADAINDIFKTIAFYESSEKNIDDLLEGPICHGGFKRLN